MNVFASFQIPFHKLSCPSSTPPFGSRESQNGLSRISAVSSVPRSIHIFNPCIWPLSRFPQMRPTLLLPPDFSRCSCVKSEAEGGKRVTEMGRPHGTPIMVFGLCDSSFSSKGSALWDRDGSYIPQTQGTLHTFKRYAKKRLSLPRHSPKPLLSEHKSRVLGKCLWSSN